MRNRYRLHPWHGGITQSRKSRGQFWVGRVVRSLARCYDLLPLLFFFSLFDRLPSSPFVSRDRRRRRPRPSVPPLIRIDIRPVPSFLPSVARARSSQVPFVPYRIPFVRGRKFRWCRRSPFSRRRANRGADTHAKSQSSLPPKHHNGGLFSANAWRPSSGRLQ